MPPTLTSHVISIRRVFRRVLPTLIVTTAAVTAALFPSAAAAATALPPQGLYEECAPSNQQQCAGELAQMGSAGFKLALNYEAWQGTPADLEQYASEAQAAGVKLIWPLNDLPWRNQGSLTSDYPKLAASCGCTTNADFLSYAIGLVKSLPATWGYYIGDELASNQAPAVSALAQAVRAVDPSHPLLYVGQGGSPDANLSPFVGASDVVGADIYPVGLGAPTSDVGWVATRVQQLATNARRSGAMVLQAFSWSEYPTEVQAPNPRWPTEAEMLTMRDQAVASGTSMILWYNLKDILQSDNPAAHWQDLVSAAFAPLPAAATAGAGGSGTQSGSTGSHTPRSGTHASRRSRAHTSSRSRAHVARVRGTRERRHRHRRHHHHRRAHHRGSRSQGRRL